jgi:2-oxoglutarate ferredoxin oxidoreductase subunit alpha
VDDFSFYDSYTADKADTLIISYGVSSRAARAVFNELKSTEDPVSLLVLKTIWPVPAKVIRQATRGIKRVLVVEMNLGQYVQEIERILPDKPVELLAQMDGRLITPRAIKEKIVNG